MRSFGSRVAVVTGAGSGIGRALSVELARRGARLAISDRRDDGLGETEALARALGADVMRCRLDVTDRDAVVAHADAVRERFGVVHQLYNNAGISLGRSITDSSWEDYERVLAVNLWGVIHGTKAFLPHLIASGDGHLVNVSSLNGYMGQGGLSAYCAAKFGVRGFTESVRQDLADEGHPVRVSVVHPGGVRTDIARSFLAEDEAAGRAVTDLDRRRVAAYDEKLLRMDPEQAARIVLDGVAKGRPRIRVGRDAVAVDLLVRALPAHYPRVVAAWSRRVMGT